MNATPRKAGKKLATKKSAKKKPVPKPAVTRSAAKTPAGKKIAAQRSAARTPSVAGTGTAAAPSTLEAFMQQALVMELEAAQRYGEFADAMEIHNNREVADMFRKMAKIEGKHAQQIMAEMGWKEVPAMAEVPAWEGFEAPETAPGDEIHYLMRPWHVLQLALANEERAERFFARLASTAAASSVRKAALDLQKEERDHVELIQAWINKVPQPDQDWAVDPDPPRYDG